MAKNFYAVKRGYDKKEKKKVHDMIFTDWKEVKPLIAGYDDARYKGFDTKEEAETWLSVVDRTDAERRAKKTIEEAKDDIGIDDISLDDYDAIRKNILEKEEDYIKSFEKLVIKYKNKGWDRYRLIGLLIHWNISQINALYK